MFKANKIGRDGRQFFTLPYSSVSALHEPYITPGGLPTDFKDFLFFSFILLDSTRFLRTLSVCCSKLTAKFNKVSSFKFTILNFF